MVRDETRHVGKSGSQPAALLITTLVPMQRLPRLAIMALAVSLYSTLM